MSDPAPRRRRRARTLLVLLPLAVGLAVAGAVGASLLWAGIPDREVSEPTVTCWNGERGPLSTCAEPAGKAGLRYVFPTFRVADQAGRCTLVARRPRTDKSRPVEFACALQLDQRRVTVVYTARTALGPGLSFLRRTYGLEPTSEDDGKRLVFRANESDEQGIFRGTVAYAEHPFSVTVEAPDLDLRDTALAELVELRPADQVLVRASAGS